MTVTILQGDCRERLREMAAGSVHMVCTSPPYWGLRDYGLPPSIWEHPDTLAYRQETGDDGVLCEHEWGDSLPLKGKSNWDTFDDYVTDGHGAVGKQKQTAGKEGTHGQFCRLCSAWRGSLGLEPTPDLFVAHLVEVMRDVWRVLRDDGTLWLNLGSSYAGSPNQKSGAGEPRRDMSGGMSGRFMGTYDQQTMNRQRRTTGSHGFKPKDLIPIPWMVAMALQQDGWYLRSSIIWAKGISFCPTYSGSVMPESVRDRPTSAYEHVFLLTKRARYYYDQEAVREAQSQTSHGGNGANAGDKQRLLQYGADGTLGQTAHQVGASGRNLRNVWAINPAGFPGAHFATFPPALIRPMILAGTSERGCCGECGAPWERVTAKATGGTIGQSWHDHSDDNERGNAKVQSSSGYQSGNTLGWRPGCNTCYPATPWPFADKPITPDQQGIALPLLAEYAELETVPCVTLDPFGGAGTTALESRRQGRDSIYMDLSPDYCEMARRRLEGTEEIETSDHNGDTVAMEQATLFSGVRVE